MAIKNCDSRISACWITAQVRETKICLLARIKGLVGAVVMAPFAHIGNAVSIGNGDGAVSIGITGFSF